MPPTITVVRDLQADLTPTLRTLNSPQQGVIVAMVRPGARNPGWLANDMLTAMGKQTGKGYGADGWPVAVNHAMPWLVVDDIHHLIVGYADTMQTSQMATIAQLGQLTETDVTFVMDTNYTDDAHTFVNEFGAQVIDVDQFDAHYKQRLRPLPTVKSDPTADFPQEVPEDSALTFLATAQQTLSDTHAQQVKRLYVSAYDTTARWLATTTGTPDEPDVAAHLSALIGAEHTLAAVTTAARGMQAAALRHGLHIRVDPRRFLQRANETRTSIDLTAEDWKRVATNGNVRQCAIAVLAAAGLSVPQIRELNADQIAADGSTVRTDSGTHHIPAPARRLLQAQMLYRAAAADPTDPQFLTAGRKEKELTVRGISAALDELARTSGIAFRATNGDWAASASHWRQRSGISVKDLTR